MQTHQEVTAYQVRAEGQARVVSEDPRNMQWSDVFLTPKCILDTASYSKG